MPAPEHTSNLSELFAAVSLYGDAKAFETLFRQQHERLYRFALQYLDNRQMAEEAVNDVFVKLWRYRATLHTVANPESYLFIAVKNQSLNYLKRFSHLHVVLTEDNGSAIVSGQTPQQDMEWKELQFRLQQVVDSLPEQCRKIFRLVKEEGMKPKQVADILNLSVRTVETQLYRAVKRLDAVLPVRKDKPQRRGGDAIISLLLLAGLLG